jgi:hypothetical protein
MGLRHQIIIFILRPTGWIIAISRDVTLYFLELLYELKDLPLYIASELRLFSGNDAVPYLREKPISEIAPVYEQRSIRFLQWFHHGRKVTPNEFINHLTPTED